MVTSLGITIIIFHVGYRNSLLLDLSDSTILPLLPSLQFILNTVFVSAMAPKSAVAPQLTSQNQSPHHGRHELQTLSYLSDLISYDFPFVYSFLAMLPLLFLERVRHVSASGSLHWLLLLPEMFFPQKSDVSLTN